MELPCQIVASILAVLSRALLALYEHLSPRSDRAQAARWAQISSWSLYLLSVFPWTFLYLTRRNWIAVAMEICGLPGMILALVAAWHVRTYTPPTWLNRLTIACIIVGLSMSSWDALHGLGDWSQLCELGMAAGFLVGTYHLAHKRLKGYYWYLFMHVCCAGLMYRQGRYVLLGQQGISFLITV